MKFLLLIGYLWWAIIAGAWSHHHMTIPYGESAAMGLAWPIWLPVILYNVPAPTVKP